MYERSPAPREAGAWISLTVTGLKVLTKLIPAAEISRISYRPPDRAVYVTRHWRTGEVLARRYSSSDLKEDVVQARTHRQPMLELILSHLPAGVVQYGRRVSDVATSDGKATLEFEGGDSEMFDLVVAADGIYSGIRKKFFPEHVVGYRGAVAYRTIFPKSLLDGIEGLHDDSSAWRANGQFVFLSELGLGMYGIVILRGETMEHNEMLKWNRSVGPEGVQRLRELYASWDPVIGKVLERIEDIAAYPLEAGPWLKTLAKDNCVAFVGDAAHPTAGAYGAGGAMGYGDCWALYRALESTTKRDGGYDAPRALRMLNETRIPFLSRVETQMGVDRLDAQYVAAAGEDETEWVRRFNQFNIPNDWLVEHDVELEIQKALAIEPRITSQA